MCRSTMDQGILVFRTDNTDEAREVILRNRLNSVTEKDLEQLG